MKNSSSILKIYSINYLLARHHSLSSPQSLGEHPPSATLGAPLASPGSLRPSYALGRRLRQGSKRYHLHKLLCVLVRPHQG